MGALRRLVRAVALRFRRFEYCEACGVPMHRVTVRTIAAEADFWECPDCEVRS